MSFPIDGSAVVTDMLEGLVACVPHLNHLDGFPEVKVLYHQAAESGKRCNRVSVISGGGAGHEPASAGFVGAGMLTAAVCGDVFASPSSAAVLAAIRHVTGPAGALLVVTNYTGDRLHFGIAAEKAKAEGYKVAMAIVGDDCALPGEGLAGRRGIAGTTFVQKVAGAAAESGATLEQVLSEAEAASSAVGTVGVATSACTLPGAEPSDRVPKGKMEFGMGVHGEPGAATVVLAPLKGVVTRVLDTIAGRADSEQRLPHLHLPRGRPVALLINSLGATTQLELLIAAKEALHHASRNLNVDVQRMYVGHLVTSLNMAGFSISIADLGIIDVSRLDAPTQAPGWPANMGRVINDTVPAPVPSPPSHASEQSDNAARLPDKRASDAMSNATSCVHSTPKGQQAAATGQEKLNMMGRCITAAAERMKEAAGELDAMDSRVGDGDCGSTLAVAAGGVLQDLPSYPLNDVAAAVGAVGESIGRTAGGTSGGLYHVMLAATSASLRDRVKGSTSPPDLAAWATAAAAGVDAVRRYGGAKPGNRTMMDALQPALEALTHAAGEGQGVAEAVSAAAKAATDGAEATKEMTAGAGRSSYIPEAHLRDTADPGAYAVGLWLSALAKELAS